ncbi:MAG: hypothetical protein CMP77_01970 [Flavobacterium sp.]|nr:hypothetical protein [Flavobacterium sp.]MBE98726.1 hypothetical protein [Flavobacterium sp.]|tara:strand:- start:6827 stop:7117 length:291 start_codon:yes stop_codon:yes gene_type:complete
MDYQVTTVSLADRVKSLIKKDSAYGVAKILGLNIQTVINWYKRGTVMEDATGIQVAELLKMDPQSVLLWLQVERAEKKGNAILSRHWRDIAQQQAA